MQWLSLSYVIHVLTILKIHGKIHNINGKMTFFSLISEFGVNRQQIVYSRFQVTSVFWWANRISFKQFELVQKLIVAFPCQTKVTELASDSD